MRPKLLHGCEIRLLFPLPSSQLILCNGALSSDSREATQTAADEPETGEYYYIFVYNHQNGIPFGPLKMVEMCLQSLGIPSNVTNTVAQTLPARVFHSESKFNICFH